MSDTVRTQRNGETFIVTIERPEARNAVDGPTAAALVRAFDTFEGDDTLKIAILTGAGGTFCAGADLKAIGSGEGNRVERDITLDGPMGPTRRLLSKPVIAAVEGYAVAGGLELALWCDLRVAGDSAVFGVFCRRWGVPLIDGGTVRLPRIVGQGRALDMILTGREVGAPEALQFGLATMVVPAGHALDAALVVARRLAALPQTCLRSDRQSTYRQWDLPIEDALALETEVGLATLLTGEGIDGAQRFADGAGRGGAPA
jgi:enoyl-CoA hydratase/carnithine racemase